MTQTIRFVSLTGLIGLVFGTSSLAFAQVDVNPPRPNVLLLVDSSGSMEYTTSARQFPTCDPTTTNTNSAVLTKSRWVNLIEALTGTIPDYRCETVPRNTNKFLSEYQLSVTVPPGTPNPPDYLYPIPYHRPMSGNCSPTVGADNNSIRFCTYDGVRPCQNCTFPDASGGLLDAFSQEIRFGLMTFDTLPSASTGEDGTWTYSWGSAVMGAPKDCVKTEAQDVGARNALAPLWEGRLITFGSPTSSNELDMIRTKNTQIQQALLATRPFGATPIAGMLKDARDFFWNDSNPDGSGDTAPKDDPYIGGGCRSNFIILLTDGEPNMDLRPYCENTSVNPACGPLPGSCCPFDKPEDIVHSLSLGSGGAQVQTYVVGFAVSQTLNQGTPVQCTQLADTDLTSPTGLCATTTNSQLQVCCKLNQIAYNGGTQRAYFADTAEQLRTALATILDNTAKSTTSRTFPVFASATGSNSASSSFRFYTSFKPKISGAGLWQGVIERQRFVCNPGDQSPTLVAIDPEKGDDFVKNVNSTTSPARRFLSVLGDTTSSAVYSTRTIRTYSALAQGDGVGNYKGTQIDGDASGFSSAVTALSMNIATSPCIAEAGMTADKCRDRYTKWLVGLPNGSTENYNRCATVGAPSCSLVADIYHSVPALVNRPNDSLRDESYQRFSLTEQRKRPLVLYTSTNDGLLHAFKVASNDPADTAADAKVETRSNNELWAFAPPAVLPHIVDEYPNVHQPLLDGAPVTRDVAGVRQTTTGNILFERDLKTIASTDSIWRTVLVQSFGGSYPGYFALDITDPVAGPQFLWQLTTDASGSPLFGDSGSTPTIATLYFDPSGGANPREISVAILPGGNGGAPPIATGTGCDRADLSPSGFDTTTKPRLKVPCYTDDAGTTNRAAARRGRSLTIVRLDTGEILRTFRRSAVDAPASISGRLTVAPLDSPITGQPVAYPGWTGAIADRVYVGDRDGSMWRVDLTSPRPTDWNMKVFFDAYRGKTAFAGQPIATSPILSTNDLGQVVVAFSTGNQDDLVTTAATETYLYSLTEVATSAVSNAVSASINWYYRFTGGERITGPMTLFSNALFYSTYAPPTGSNNACSSGSSRVGGMHYLNPDKTAGQSVDGDDLSRGGIASLPRNGDGTSLDRVQFYSQTDQLFQTGSVIFGVGIAQVPSCYQTGAASTDPFFGSAYKPTTTTSTTSFQLVMQTGSQGTTASGGQTKTIAVNLPPPDSSPRIDSWALVME